MSEYFETYAPDFPAFGSSDPIKSPWAVGDYAEWLYSFFKAADIKSAHILAHSFGGRVALKFSAAHPEAVNKLIITGGAGVVEKDKKTLKRERAYGRLKRFSPRLAYALYASDDYKNLSPVMRESFKRIIGEDLREEAAKIAAPTLLLYGEDDKSAPADREGAIFASEIVGSRLEIMRGGHFCFSQYPEVFNRKILNFLIS